MDIFHLIISNFRRLALILFVSHITNGFKNNFDQHLILSKTIFKQLSRCQVEILFNSNSLAQVIYMMYKTDITFTVISVNINKSFSYPTASFTLKRRSNCYVHLNYFSYLSLNDKKFSGLENPDYVIYFIPEIINWDDAQRTTKIILNTLKTTMFTAPTIAIINFSTVFSICFACLQQIILLSEPEDRKINLWRWGKNFNGMYVETDMSSYERWEYRAIDTCDYSTLYTYYDLPPPKEVCVVLKLSKIFNFTFGGEATAEDDGQREYYTKLGYISMLSKLLVSSVETKQRKILEGGFGFDRWAFLIAIKIPQRTQDNSALTGPFDTYIWLALFISYILTCILLIVSVVVTSESHLPQISISFDMNLKSEQMSVKVADFILIILNVFASIMDQAMSLRFTKLCFYSFSNSILLVWALWCGLILVSSQAYKGKLFSFLTETPQPAIPSNLEELVNSGLFLTTFTSTQSLTDGARSTRTGNNKSPIKSFLQSSTLTDIFEERDYPSYYIDLNYSLHFTPTRFGDLYGMFNFVTNLYLYYNPFLLSKNSTFKISTIPEDFSILDSSKTINMIKYLLDIHVSHDKWISSAVNIEDFIQRWPWTVDKNHFYPVLLKYLGWFSQNGLYSRWERIRGDYSCLRSIHSIRYSLATIVRFNIDKIVYAIDQKLWFNYFISEVSNKRAMNNPQPVTLSVFHVVWIFCGILLSVACTILLIEMLYKKHK